MKKLLITGARVIDPSDGRDDLLDVLLQDGRIAAIGAPGCFSTSVPDGDTEILPSNGLVCAPGLVDMHVHLRDPGQTHKEDLITGCRAAAAGGVTSVAAMPNTTPVCDDPAIIKDIRTRAGSTGVHVYPVGAVTHALRGEQLTDFAVLKAAGAVAVSDDGRPIPTAGLMMDAMRRAAELQLPLLSHCEDLSIVRGGIMNTGVTADKLGVPGSHPAAEETAIARDIALAASTGCPVHICHVSTRGSVALLRDARRRGVPVTAETAPHYFTLTDELLERRDADYRMNPPLRTREDIEAVIEGLCDGTLSAIATDHAPHTAQEKRDFLHAPNGAVGLETSLAAGITALVKPGHLTLAQLLTLMSTAPAQLLGISGGTLAVGSPADLVLFDPEESWTVDPAALHGKSRNTPFKGMTLTGRIKRTIVGGETIYNETSSL